MSRDPIASTDFARGASVRGDQKKRREIIPRLSVLTAIFVPTPSPFARFVCIAIALRFPSSVAVRCALYPTCLAKIIPTMNTTHLALSSQTSGREITTCTIYPGHLSSRPRQILLHRLVAVAPRCTGAILRLGWTRAMLSVW